MSARRFSPVTRLVGLVFASPDPARQVRFYRTVMGFAALGPNRVAAGPAPCFLEFQPAPEPALLCTVYEVEDLREARGHLEAAGVPYEERPEGLALEDVEGRRLVLQPPQEVPDPTPLAYPGPYLQHVTYTTRNPVGVAEWYERALGFRVSDWQGRNFVWLRCGPPHHVMAAVRGPEVGLDHYALEVASWEDMKRWADHLATRGIPLIWGPGRHGPGNNLFLFFHDADRNRVELSAELERFYDERAHYPPREWPDSRWAANQWGPQPDWRRPEGGPVE
ncbi:MAG: VOC family protein [Armatimonadetes bacterium]|nr:VOC family protein [Armatimonadota bacterium]MDW8153230.1 VOC family protein [Armatimonadota bacterium]